MSFGGKFKYSPRPLKCNKNICLIDLKYSFGPAQTKYNSKFY